MDRRAFVLGGTAAATAAVVGCSAQTAPRAPSPPDPTGNRFASLHGFCDGVDPPDGAELDSHVECLRGRMHEAELDAIVVEPGTNMLYLTGVRWGLSERPFLLVIRSDADPVWVNPAFETGTARERVGSNAKLVPWEEHESPFANVATALGASGRVALDPAMRLFVASGITNAVGTDRIANGVDPIGWCRMRKDARELARLRRANEATKEALRVASGLVEAGMTEHDLAALLRQAQEAAGLSDVWVLPLFGKNAAFPHGTRAGATLRSGDLILVDTGGSLFGYRSDITRTWPFGAASKRARAAWSAVREAQTAAFSRIRPGVRCHEPDAAARAVIEKAGFGADYGSFTHRLGHGIGMQGHEPPYLVRGNELVLEAGMTMSNEPGIYIPGELGVRLEDILVVTEDGCEVFGPEPHSIEQPFGIPSRP